MGHKVGETMHFLMTVDVEGFSIPLNRCDHNTSKEVYEIGLPRLLDLLARHDIPATFYFTGKMAEAFPGSVELVMEHGHEIGCHGYDHSHDRAFDVLSYSEQLSDLEKAKDIITGLAGRIESFRAPALRLNESTVRALEKTGFRTDSSICSQRFDGPFTFGSKKKLNWLFAPRKPYFLSYSSIFQRGGSKILEIPVSALFFSYSGTVMRRAPNITKLLQKSLFMESRATGKPLIFLFHPNECLDAGNSVVANRRASSYIQYLFSDVIRQRLKLNNLGMNALKLLDELFKSAKEYNPEFITVKDYRKSYRGLDEHRD